MDSETTGTLGELFDLVDENDTVIGTVRRAHAHGNPDKIHRVAHVLVFDAEGLLFLQKRGEDKDVQPGKWDTSVGGHVDSGESYEEAAAREMHEELGIEGAPLEHLYKYLHRNEYESEYVTTYRCIWGGPIEVHPAEITEGRFWSLAEIDAASESIFTPNFLDELRRYRDAFGRRSS